MTLHCLIEKKFKINDNDNKHLNFKYLMAQADAHVFILQYVHLSLFARNISLKMRK